jgi:hypothetical protein
LAEIAPTIRKAEARLGRAVNPTVYTPEQFAKKLKVGHHFLQSILREEMLFVLGERDDLAAALGKQLRAKTRDKSSGT